MTCLHGACSDTPCRFGQATVFRNRFHRTRHPHFEYLFLVLARIPGKFPDRWHNRMLIIILTRPEYPFPFHSIDIDAIGLRHSARNVRRPVAGIDQVPVTGFTVSNGTQS